jgi:hypothetical protein
MGGAVGEDDGAGREAKTTEYDPAKALNRFAVFFVIYNRPLGETQRLYIKCRNRLFRLQVFGVLVQVFGNDTYVLNDVFVRHFFYLFLLLMTD